MGKREAQYCGYTIEVQRNRAGWNVWVCPSRPELPSRGQILSTRPRPPKAIAEAVQRIEQLLSR
jgi:hypothetical protein